MNSNPSSLPEDAAVLPDAIETKSFEIIRGLLPELTTPRGETPVLLRIIHTTGDPSLLQHTRIHPNAVEAGLAAIRTGQRIIVDVRMVAAGINKTLAQRFGCSIICAIDHPEAKVLAASRGSTRAEAAMRLLHDQLDGSIVAIGNAPTALSAVIDIIDTEGKRPALIVGTPVGFVGAAEAKAELTKRDIPYITVLGTRGGSPIAAAVVNALLKMEV